MRAICVQQPWAGLIASGEKSIEVRSWTTKYRGPLAILVSRAYSRHAAAAEHRDRFVGVGLGRVACVVDLVDVREGVAADARAAHVDPTGQFSWVLASPRAASSDYVVGRLGLFVPQFHIRLAS